MLHETPGGNVHVKITAASKTINTTIKTQIHHPLFVSIPFVSVFAPILDLETLTFIPPYEVLHRLGDLSQSRIGVIDTCREIVQHPDATVVSR